MAYTVIFCIPLFEYPGSAPVFGMWVTGYGCVGVCEYGCVHWSVKKIHGKAGQVLPPKVNLKFSPGMYV